jgi:hypothetical protein
MAELERELRVLAEAVEWPAEPDLAARVRTRLGEPRRSRRRLIAAALAALAVLIGAAFAVPDSRSAILRLFGLEGVTVIQVDELPRVGRGPLVFGDRTTLVQAERELGFTALLPNLGRPEDVRVDPGGGYLIVLYDSRIRLSEFRSGPSGPFLLKKLSADSRVRRLTVNGGPGLWVPGGHLVFELGRQPRLAGNTLLWEQGRLTLRLEGRFTLAKALEIARSVRRREDPRGAAR